MPLPKRSEIEWVTVDCYGTLIDWDKGISEAFSREAAEDGLTLDVKALLMRFYEIQYEVMAGSYELYAEVLRRAAVKAAGEVGWSLEPSRAQFLPDSIGEWQPFREANAAMDRLGEKYLELRREYPAPEQWGVLASLVPLADRILTFLVRDDEKEITREAPTHAAAA